MSSQVADAPGRSGSQRISHSNRSLNTSPLPPITRPKSSSLQHHHPHHVIESNNTHRVHAPLPFQSGRKFDDTTLRNIMGICHGCQDTLIHAYNHCLMKNNMAHSHEETTAALFPSLAEVDEVEDAKLLQESPIYQPIADPTIDPNELFEDAATAINRERWCLMQDKQEDLMHTKATIGKVRYEVEPTGKLTTAKSTASGMIKSPLKGKSKIFSGAIYKRMLDAKDRELHRLRKELYDRVQVEHFDKGNVERLKFALSKSMKFYTNAEEWHASESERLMQDVRILKAEISSIMAFLIQSEEEKHKVQLECNKLHAIMNDHEIIVKHTKQEAESYKDKLHAQYKEFLEMNKAIAQLKKEALRGSDAAESRNEVLQKNLDRVSQDYEASTRAAQEYQAKIKELEFELSELVSQFNSTGEAKRKVEEEFVNLGRERETLVQERDSYTEKNQLNEKKIDQLSEEMLKAKQLHQETKAKNESTIIDLTIENGNLTQTKLALEDTVDQLKREMERLLSALQNMTEAKESLEEQKKAIITKSEREILALEARIHELTDLRTEDSKTLRRLQDLKEQLVFQNNELQNNLDQELSTANMLRFEMGQVKHQFEEKEATFEEQIENLTAERLVIQNDKKQMSAKIKMMREQAIKLEKEYKELETVHEVFKHEQTTAHGDLSGALESITKEYHQLQEERRDLVKSLNTMTQERDSWQEKADITEGDLSTMTNTAAQRAYIITKHEDLIAILQKDLMETTLVRDETKRYLEAMRIKAEELKEVIANLKAEEESGFQERDDEIKDLKEQLEHLNNEKDQAIFLNGKLRRAGDRLNEQLKEAYARIEEELGTIEVLETRLDDLRRDMQHSLKDKMDEMRVDRYVHYRQEKRNTEREASMKRRNTILSDMETEMQQEFIRLRDVSNLLPRYEANDLLDAPNAERFNVRHQNVPAIHKTLP